MTPPGCYERPMAGSQRALIRLIYRRRKHSWRGGNARAYGRQALMGPCTKAREASTGGLCFVLFEWRYHTKLLEQPQIVRHSPVFYQLTAGNAVNHNAFSRYLLAVRRDAQILS